MSLKNRISLAILVIFVFLPFQMNLTGAEFKENLALEQSLQNSKSREWASKIIEDFLKQEVPGLNLSYRKFFDMMIDEGFEVYLMGGAIRDLLSNPQQNVNDVDFNFLASKEELLVFLKKHRWQYTTLPNSQIVTIGENDNNQHTLEGRGTSLEYMQDKNNYEFTVNEIFYNLKDKTFFPNFENSLQDIQNKRLRISASNWKKWFEISTPYKKVFRFWKMTGKGYIYSVEVENYVRELVQDAMINHPDEFYKELIKYLGTHLFSFDDVTRGCKNTMGYDWCESTIVSRKNAILNKETSFKNKQANFTFKPDIDF